MKRTCSTNKILAFFAADIWKRLAMAGQALAQSTLTNQLVGYWPLDGAVGCNNQTPDVINGYNLSVGFGGGTSAGFPLTNFNSIMFFTNDAIHGNALYYHGSTFSASPGNGLFLAYKSVNTNDFVPVNRYSPASNTLSFWMKSETPAANWGGSLTAMNASGRNQIISEPTLSVIDVSGDGASYDFFLRQTPDGTAPAVWSIQRWQPHARSRATLIDGNWHNFTLRQRREERERIPQIIQSILTVTLTPDSTLRKAMDFGNWIRLRCSRWFVMVSPAK